MVAVAMLGILAIAIAAKPTKPLIQVTVAVDGLHCQACVDELQQDLAKVPGVSAVTVTMKPGQAVVKLDEHTMSASKLVATIAAHPQAMNHQKTYGAQLVLFVDSAGCAKQAKMCPACFTEIPKMLKKVAGIDTVRLDDTGKVARVTFTKHANVSTSALAKALAASDFKFTTRFLAPTAAKPAAKQAAQGGSCCE